ncbi:MAG: PAS domain S-box protein [Cyclobacteriaceae bacterium]|nr:PAS domain S-box protein [Cyclobacteriaceae bacterium]
MNLLHFQEGEERLVYAAMETSMNAVFISDMQGKISYANQSAAEMWGYDNVNSLLAEKPNVLDYWTPDSKDNASEIINELIHAGKYKGEGLIGIRKDLTTFIVEIKSTLIRNEEGVPQAMVGTFLDITDRLEAESALKHSEAIYRAIVDNMNSAVALYDVINDGADFVFKDFNKAGEKIESISKEKVIGKSVKEIFPGVDKFGILDVFKDVFQTGTPRYFPVSFYDDGRIKGWRENYVHKLPTGEIFSLYTDLTNQKLAEENEKKRVKELEAIYKSMIDGMVIFDYKSREILIMNDRFFQITGYALDELKKEGIQKIYLPGSYPSIQNQLNQIVEGKLDVARDIPIITCEGKKIWVDIKCDVINYSDQKAVICFYRDVTERAKYLDLIKQQTYELNKAQEIGNMGSWVWNIEEGTLSWSDQIYRIFGLQPQEFLATYEAFLSFIHPDDVEIVTSGVNMAINGEKEYNVIHRVMWKDGTIRTVNERGEVFFNDKGAPQKMVGTVKDITEQKEYEEELTRQAIELRFRSQIINQIHDSVIATDNNGVINYWNPGAEKLFGYTSSEMLGQSISKIYTDMDDKLLAQILSELKEKGENESELRLVRKDGEIFYAHISFSMLYNEKKQAIGLIRYCLDISTRKKVEERLRENEATLEKKVTDRTIEIGMKNQELELINSELNVTNQQLIETLHKLKQAQGQLIESEKMASLGVLTAGIAHEINNPINFIYAGINSLKENLKDVMKVVNSYNQLTVDNVQATLNEINSIKQDIEFERLIAFVDKSTENIQKGAERTSEIIRGLRSFSRMDDEKLVNTDLHDSLENSLLLLHNKYKDRIVINKQYAAIPIIQAYAGKISQVFLNIIGNAVQAIEDKGEITIRTEIMESEKMIRVSISDSGTGMSEATMKRIFEPFYTTKEVGKGTGLGLSISHSIIESHNGNIKVESTLGKGTTFIICLPIN